MNQPFRDHALSHEAEDADEREFEAFAQGQAPLDIAAATWVTRRRNGLDAQGQAEFQDWLDAAPEHRKAFEDMAGTFDELQQLPQGEVAALKAPAMAITDLPRRKRKSPLNPPTLMPRLATAAFVIAVLAGGYLGLAHWRERPTFAHAYATARGQQLTVHLPDDDRQGSTLQLDTATRVDARLYRHRREVDLQDGQAMLTVAPDAQRPLQVNAGPLRITVTGTRFSVRHTASGMEADQTVVSVEEGHVRVEVRHDHSETAEPRRRPDGRQIVLKAGQKVVADSNGRIGPVLPVSPMAIATWRTGRISFEQTPLNQALAEFERYGQTGLVVRDPAVAALPIGGSYKLQQAEHFAASLPQVLPVRLVPHGDLTEIVAR